MKREGKVCKKVGLVVIPSASLETPSSSSSSGDHPSFPNITPKRVASLSISLSSSISYFSFKKEAVVLGRKCIQSEGEGGLQGNKREGEETDPHIHSLIQAENTQSFSRDERRVNDDEGRRGKGNHSTTHLTFPFPPQLFSSYEWMQRKSQQKTAHPSSAQSSSSNETVGLTCAKVTGRFSQSAKMMLR